MDMMNPSEMVDWIWCFGPEDIQWARNAPEGSSKRSTTHQGAPGAPGTPKWVVPSLLASHTASLLYKYPNIPETLGESAKIHSVAAESKNTRSNPPSQRGSSCPLVPLQ